MALIAHDISLPLPVERTANARGGRRRVTLETCYLFTRQLAVLQKAGVPVLSSLSALQEQLPDGTLKPVLEAIHQDLLEGRTLSQALAEHPRVFSPIYVGMVRVGESGGILDEVLRELAVLYEWEIDLRARLAQAIRYPLIVLGTLAMAMAIMVVFVVPRFAEMFRSFQVELPFQTRLLIGLSHLVTHYGWLIALVAGLLAFAWWRYLRTEQGKLRWHTWKLRLPILGPVVRQMAMSRVARTIAALNKSGLPILETLALTGQGVNNRYVRAELAAVRQQVQAGETLSKALKQHPVFPPIVVQMVATGEETGRMDELLTSVSAYYDQQLDYLVRRLIAYIEPMLLVVVGLGVLLMATAVLVPWWDMVKLFKVGR